MIRTAKSTSTPRTREKLKPVSAHREQDALVGVYIFADRRNSAKLRNDIINTLASMREVEWPLLSGSFDRVDRAFSFLPPGSALRHYLIEEANRILGRCGKSRADIYDKEELVANAILEACSVLLSRPCF